MDNGEHLECLEPSVGLDPTRWNSELHRIYGTDPESFKAAYETFLSLVHPDDRDKLFDVNNDAANRASRADEFRSGLERRRQALEINDNVVQGLAALVYSLELGRTDIALAAARGTLDAARQMMADLLGDVPAAGFDPGVLVRDRPAPSLVVSSRSIAPTSLVSALRVLIADDSADMRMLMREALLLRGYDVVGEASDGMQAIEEAARKQPDVVLLDLAMPSMDGLEALPRIREAAPAAKVVVVSGFSEGGLGEAAMASGADAYLEKGSSTKRLNEVIFGLCARTVDD